MTPRTLRPSPRQRLDPVDIWRREHRADHSRRPHYPGCGGHGWMLDAGLVEVLTPLLYGDAFDDTSFFRFTSLDADTADRLLALLGEDYLAQERQNDGPTIGSVLRAVVAHPDTLRAHGYVIGPSRCDERITVEGVLFRADREYRLCPLYGPPLEECECERLYERLRDEFGVDDAFVPPHELDRWRGYDWTSAGYQEGTWYRAWWD